MTPQATLIINLKDTQEISDLDRDFMQFVTAHDKKKSVNVKLAFCEGGNFKTA